MMAPMRPRSPFLVLLSLGCASGVDDGGGADAGDTTAPSIPLGLLAVATSESRVNLSWSPSTDDTGVTAYVLFRDGNELVTTASTSHADIGLAAATEYEYRVLARDAA